MWADRTIETPQTEWDISSTAGERTNWGEGDATGSYASVAAAQPWGLTALRFRGVRYWWAGLGVLVLGLMYLVPIAAAFRQPAVSTQSSDPLPALEVPSFSFPLFRVPTVHRLKP